MEKNPQSPQPPKPPAGSRYRVFDAPSYDRPGGPTRQPNVRRHDHYEPDRTPFGIPVQKGDDKSR
jgi:hypothetical protein